MVQCRDETILQYIDILQYLLLQYNTIWVKGNIDILHIAIYCNLCCLNVVNTQLLHHNNDWTSKNTLHFLMLLYGYYRVYILYFTAKTHNYYHMKCLFTKIQAHTYCNIAIYCNTLKHNTQYSICIDLYCFTPSIVQCRLCTVSVWNNAVYHCNVNNHGEICIT